VKKEGNIDYQVDSNSVSVIVRGVVSLAMVFVFVIEAVLEWKKYGRREEVDQVEVVGGKGKRIYFW
jgi:hypothetical protein